MRVILVVGYVSDKQYFNNINNNLYLKKLNKQSAPIHHK